MFSSSLEKCDLTVLFKSWLWSYHSCLLLSFSLSNMHTQIFTDHIPFVIFLYHYLSSKFSTEVVFFREKMRFEKMETFIEKFWFHWSKQELRWLFCWLGPEHLPRNQLMWSVGGNVMIEWAVNLLCLQEEISRFSGIPYWAGTTSEV